MAKTIDELYKQYQSREKAGATAPASTTQKKADTSGFDQLYQRWRQQDYEKNRAQYESSVQQRLSDLTSRQSSFSDAYNSRYKNRNESTYYGDYDDWYQKVSQERDSYFADVDAFMEEFAKYEEFYDQDYVDSIRSSLYTGKQGYAQAVAGAQSDRDYYSSFKDEEEFRSYIAQMQEEEAKKTLNLDDAQKEIEALKEELNSLKVANTVPQNNYLTGNSPATSSPYSAGQHAQDKGTPTEQRIAELERMISQKQAYMNSAKHIQNGIALAGAITNDDFDDFSGYATTKSDDITASLTSEYGLGYDDLTYEYINNQNGIRDEIKHKYTVYGGGVGESVYVEKGYDHMTEDEISIYNYYYAKEGKEKAQEYLDSIQETLNQRKAGEIFEPLEDQTLMELAFGVAAGLDQFESGVKSLLNFKDDYIPVSATQYASGMVREDLEDVGTKLPEWMGGASLGQVGYDAITTSANMAPSILAGSVVAMLNPAAGVTIAGKTIAASEAVSLGLMGAGAAGNAYQQALNEGYSKGQARAYGTMIGASEIVLEKLLGGISAFGGNSPVGEILTGNIVNADTALKMIAKKIPSSMISEFTEEYLQEVLTPVFENMILRTDNEVKFFSAEALYSGILGALTAVAMEGPSTIAGEVRTNNIGKDLLAQGIDTKKLAEVGSKFAADTVAYQLAGKVNENTGAYTIGRLFNEIGATLTEQNKSQITEALVQEDMPRIYAKKHAEILAYIIEGGEVSDIQMKMIESNPMVSKVLREVVINPNSTVYQRTMGYNEVLMQLAQEKAGSNASRINPGKQGEANVSSEGNLTSSTKVLSQSNYEASEDGKTILDGKEVTLDGIRKMADGTTMVATADNLTADPSEVTYPSKDHALVYESYVNLESTTSNPVIASMPVEARSALAKSYTPAAGVPAKVFVQGSNQAYWYGFEGISLNEKSVSSNSLVMSISKEQREFAYDLGRKAGEKAVKTQSAGIKAAYDAAIEKLGGKDAAKAVAKRNKGSVVLDDGIRKSAMTPQQKATYKLAGKVAQAVGTNIRLYHGMKEFGMYSQKNGEIWLNINAMFNGQSMMLFTLSHELVHMAKQWSPAEFNSFANELLEQFGEKGVSVEALIKKQMDKAKENGYELNEHEAYEEVICDACERMLLDSDAVQKMVAYKAKNPSRWQQIVDAITEFIANIRKLFNGVASDSEEAPLYAELEAAIKEHLEDKFVKMVMDAGEHMATIKNAFGKDTVVEVNENGEFTLAKGEDSDGTTKFLYNVSTWESGGRETLSAALKAEGFSSEDIKAALTIMDGKHKLVNDLAKQFPEQNRINKVTVTTDIKDGHSVLSALVSNGDYPVNIDLLMVCKKRKAYQRVINRLCETGLIQQATVDALAIAEINKILGKYGFETACLGCFVESRRMRIQEWGNTIVKEWNAEVKKRNPNAKAFGFGKGEATLTPDEVMQLIGELESGGTKNEQGNLNLGQGSAVKRMGVLLDKVPSLRRTLSIEDLITPDGLTALRKFDSNLFSMVKSRYGSNSPKFVQEFNPYNHELAMYGKVPSKYKSLREYLYAIGGARMQSFSDFIVENWFDYCQIVADLAARKLPMHTYTKEIALARLFGLTGIKINMSLIPDIDRSLGKEYAGLTRNANGELELIWADKDRFKKTGGKSYMQSINFADAIALQEDPRYSANVGTIAVGISDKHILMMLDDARIRMIIPYHSSGMNPIFADLMGTSYYKDYTNFQNTTVKHLIDRKGRIVPVKTVTLKANGEEQYNGKGIKLEKKQRDKLTSGFEFNKVLQDLGDARAAAQAYKDWCADASQHTITIKGETYTAELTPKFDDFSSHENYYKLLEDFNTYDCISEQAAPQGDVQQIYPEDFDKLLTDELKSQEKHRQKQIKDQAFDKAMGEIETYLKSHTKADTVFYAEQHGVKLGAKDKKLGAEDKKKLADLRKGMKLKMPRARDAEYLDAVKRGDMETAQRMVNDAVKAAGFAVNGYHGTTNLFYVFDTAKSNIESDWGRGIYATTSKEDAQVNYASDDGADLNHRIERLAEMMENWDEYEDMDYEQRVEAARKQLSQGESKILHLAYRMENPVVVERGNGGTFFTYKEEYDEETDEYSDPSGTLVDVIEKMKDIIYEDYEWASYDADKLNNIYDEALWGGISAIELQSSVSDWLVDVSDDDGNVAANEILRAALERMGFDGIIDKSVPYKFGALSGKRYGGMQGVVEGTTHFIAFNSSQVKLTDPVTYDDAGNVIPLSERFNPKKKDIRYKMPKVEEIKPSLEQIESNIHAVAEMSSVHDIDEGKMEKSGKKLTDIFGEQFAEWGNNIYSDVFGDIAVKNSSIRSELRHGFTPVKIASIEAIPSVITSGKIVDWIEKNNGTLFRIVVAAPITIGEKPYIMGVMLQRDNQNQRLYLHDVVVEKEASDLSQDNLVSTGSSEKNENLFMTSILQKVLDVKKQLKTGANVIEKPTDNKYIKMVENGATRIGEYDVVPKSKEPKKTILAWKALVVKPGAKNNPKDKSYGNMYPPQVHQVASTPYGVWLYANEAPKKLDKDGNPVLTKYGRPKVKEGMTYRPAWHFGDAPYASQFKSTHGFFDDNGVRRFYMSESKGILVWALCEMAADENYQDEADMAGHVGETRSWDEQQASLWYLPENGYYKYMTNRVDPNSVTWYLSDKMRIVQTITDAEMRDILTWIKEDGSTDLEFNYPLRIDGKDVDPADYGIPVGNVVGDGIDYVDRWKNQFREIAMNGDIDITQSHFYYVPSTATNYGAYETVSFSKEVDDHSQELLKTKKDAKILSVNPTSHSVPTQRFEEATGVKVKEANTLAGRKKIIEAAKNHGYDIVEFEKTGKGLGADVVIINPDSVIRDYKFNNVSERYGRTDAVKYSMPRRGGMSSRQLLADAFDELVQTPKERELMDRYRANITKVEEVQERLRKLRGEISKLTKANGDKAKINKLNETAADLVDLIDRYDRELLKLEAAKPLKDVLARARTVAQKEAKQRNEQLMKEYRQQVLERIDRSIESRRKTEMRKKIRKVIRDLNKILNQGDKKRNVKEDMKDFVAEALTSAEVLFTDNYTNEDIIRDGFGVELSKEEARYAAEAQKILEDLANLPSGTYEAMVARQEAEATLKNRLSYRMSKLKDAFFRERQRLNKTEVATVLGNLADAYAKLETSEYAYVNGAYHEAVYQYLKMLQEDVGGSKVKDMTLGQLEELYKAYTMVLTTVRNANTMFAQDLKQSKEELANRVMMEVYQAGGEHGLWSKGELARNQASWNNTKPIYAAERTGSPTFVKLVNGLFKGQYAWAVDMAEAKAYRQNVADKYGFKNWDMEKLYKFTSSSGIDFELNLNQIMSLYAYAKREQAHDHLLKGGFVFGKNTEVVVTKNGIKRTYLNKSAKAHNISDEIMGEIISNLSPEQKGFVDEMQDYLSTTMGAKGNEVSMRIYGVKLFLEKFYFPLRSAGQFKEKAKEAELKQQQGQISIVNSGFTKAVTPKASNPVVLDGFMDVWAGHVNEMSLYHSMVLPMEDFRRVYNYASPHMEGQESASVNSFIENAYGDAATGYFDQLYKELNGGAIVDPRENLSKQRIGKFKKSAVMLSNSVWVQQFSAIGRAFALIDPKYFIGAKIDKKRQAAVWNEMKQNAPVTIIKEMGGFDTHTGRSAKDFLLAEEYGKGERIQGFLKDEQYRSEIMGMLPSKADELTWCAIWEAVKRETHDKHPKMDVKSEEFLKMVGERFSEVIERTQVYDSVLARSANMRSKQGLMQMVTAFMAEPTTTVNMIEDALRKGNKTVIARTFGAVAVSIILNNALASIVYAMRDDDEDETFLEKYAQAVTSGLLDDLNPMTYYPILKDIWSLFQGYDIERSDMAIYSDIADAVKKTASLIAKYDSDMDEEEAAEYYKKVGEALMSLLDAGASAFGVPLKNVRRDLMSYFNTINTFRNGSSTTWNSFRDAVGGATLDSIPIVGLFAGKSKQDKLYTAIISGDTAYLNRLKSGYSSESSYNTAIRKALRENDPRIKEAAEARFSGDFNRYKELFLEIRDEGYFDFDTIMAAVNAEVNELEKKASGDTTNETTKSGDYEALFDVEHYYTAVVSNDQASATLIYDELVAEKVAEGYLKHEAEDSIASSFTTQVKNDYLDGEISRSRAVDLLTANTGNDETKVMEWDFQLEHGFSWSERVRKYRLGQLSEEDLISAVMEIEGESREGAEAYIDFLDLEMANDDIDITANDAASYFKYAEPAGIDIEVYLDYKDQASGLEGDKDENGNPINGSYKAKVLAVIDSLPITSAQKDALYFANGWAESKLHEAPWH